ncbi:MAG: hypothetical protein OEW87_10610, partial [Flavobacteriaceae bacterium]|nr:hypothetical protein [Flavobacteriaceae bacterium]
NKHCMMNIKINKNRILFTSAIIIILMLIFPPFYAESNGNAFSMGYAFILDPPHLSNRAYAIVHVGLLIAQWFTVLFLGAVLVFFQLSKSHECIDLEEKVNELILQLETERENVNYLQKEKEGKLKSRKRNARSNEIII